MTAVSVEAPEVAPAYVYRPPRVRSMAGQLAQLAEKLGRPLYAEQVTALDVLTGLRDDGRAASRMAAIICGRQNMKTWDMQLIALGRLLMPDGDRYAVWSAHEVATSQETFRDFLELIEADGHAWLRRRVVRVGQANGKEVIEFAGGRRLRFRARRRTGGRGLSGDSLFLDEAFALLPAHMGALLPILSTRRRAAVFVGSSAGMPESSVLRGIRDRGRQGGPGAPAYVEWCAPGSLERPGCERSDCTHQVGAPGCCLDRRDLLMLANPAVRVGRITWEALQSERDEMTPEEYARERLGWWDLPGSVARPAVDRRAWARCSDPGTLDEVRSRLAAVVDISMDGQHATLAVAGVLPDGRVRVEVVQAWDGESSVKDLRRDLPGLVAKVRPRRFGWFPAGPAAALAADMTEKRSAGWPPAGVKVEEIKGEAASACMGLAELVAAGQVAHSDDDLLTAHVAGAQQLWSGDRWRFARRGGGHCDGAYAAAGAVHLARTLPSVGKPRLVTAGGARGGSA